MGLFSRKKTKVVEVDTTPNHYETIKTDLQVPCIDFEGHERHYHFVNAGLEQRVAFVNAMMTRYPKTYLVNPNDTFIPRNRTTMRQHLLAMTGANNDLIEDCAKHFGATRLLDYNRSQITFAQDKTAEIMFAAIQGYVNIIVDNAGKRLGEEPYNPYLADYFSSPFSLPSHKIPNLIIFMDDKIKAREMLDDHAGYFWVLSSGELIMDEEFNNRPPCYFIDRSLCNSCGKCASICPEGAIHSKRALVDSWTEKLVYTIYDSRCTSCGLCYDFDCPMNAFGRKKRYYI